MTRMTRVTTMATTTFYMQKLADPLENVECTTPHEPPGTTRRALTRGKLMVPQFAEVISSKFDGWEQVAIPAHVSVPMVPRLATGTSPTPDAGECVAILAQVAVPCCRLACELGGDSEDAEGANHESSRPTATGKNESRQLNSWACWI